MKRKLPIALALLSFTLVTLDIGTSAGARAIDVARNASAGVVGPLQKATAGLVRPVDRNDELTNLRRDNLRLTAEIHRLRSGDAPSGSYTSAGSRGPAESAGPPGSPRSTRTLRSRGSVVSARVIALGSRPSLGRTAVIDAGLRDGVRPHSGVSDARGLVGRVLRAGPATSVVVLVNDPATTVGARASRSRELGLVRGDGDRLVLTTVDPGAPIRRGDRLVSWGSRAYPPGIPIGLVERVSRDESAGLVATVRPAADLTALDLVVVHPGTG